MSEKWTDHEPATSDIERVRRSLERIAQGPSVPSPTPARRATSTEQTASENQHDIAKLQAQLDELRGWVQECSDGVSNLGMRVAKLEDGG